MSVILLVEDDRDLQVTTRLVLEQHGFEVRVAGNGQEALAQVAIQEPDLALVDVMMPVMDGLTLTRRLRERGDLPVILLTARDLTHDQIQGLEAGADDYVTKPFDGDVLAARIKAVLRRGATRATSTQVGDLAVDREGMVVSVGGQQVDLSATEFRLLEAFLDHLGVVLSRRQLLERVWGSTEWGDERVVDVNIQRLRAKIGSDRIQTVRGAGYKMARA